jgi:hypothetical protein
MQSLTGLNSCLNLEDLTQKKLDQLNDLLEAASARKFTFRFFCPDHQISMLRLRTSVSKRDQMEN